jgi:hypothetical protein
MMETCKCKQVRDEVDQQVGEVREEGIDGGRGGNTTEGKEELDKEGWRLVEEQCKEGGV